MNKYKELKRKREKRRKRTTEGGRCSLGEGGREGGTQRTKICMYAGNTTTTAMLFCQFPVFPFLFSLTSVETVYLSATYDTKQGEGRGRVSPTPARHRRSRSSKKLHMPLASMLHDRLLNNSPRTDPSAKSLAQMNDNRDQRDTARGIFLCSNTPPFLSLPPSLFILPYVRPPQPPSLIPSLLLSPKH